MNATTVARRFTLRGRFTPVGATEPTHDVVIALTQAPGARRATGTFTSTDRKDGNVLKGTSFGVVQTASMAVMFARVSAAGFGTVSALWSIAYDSGFGAGAIGFGFLAGWTGYPMGFAVTAAVVLVALPLLRGRRRLG